MLLGALAVLFFQIPTLKTVLNPHDQARVVMPKLRRKRRNDMVPQAGEYAPVRQPDVIPLIQLRRAPTNEYHIFVIAEEEDTKNNEKAYQDHVKLTNLMMGLFDEPDEHLSVLSWSVVGDSYLSRYRNEWADTNTTIVSKTTETDLLQLQREFRVQFRRSFFFVLLSKSPEGSTGKTQTESLCEVPLENAMICVDATQELFYNNIDEQKVVIAKMTNRIQQEMQYFSKVDFTLKQIEALRRISYMEEMTMQMRDLPLSTSETKYGIKGGTPV